MSEPQNFPVIRGRAIHVDDQGFVCLNDIWSAAGFSKNQTPSHWTQLEITSRLVVALLEHNAKQTGILNYNAKSVLYAKRGKGGGTYADIRLALAYAEYLNAKLALEVREVFLRYKAADPTLADDILQRATPEANEWAGARALGRSVRHQYTQTLKDHGATGKFDYGMCTNAVYQALFDMNATKLKAEKGVPKKGSLRDAMSQAELVYVMASETLSTERINDEQSQGGDACRVATSKSARFIRQAIEADRKDRHRQQKFSSFG